MSDFLKYIQVISESVGDSMPSIWFHGDTNDRVTFDDQVFDRNADRDRNAGGAGVYLTTDIDEAIGYGEYVTTHNLNPDTLIIKDSQPATMFVHLFDKIEKSDLFDEEDVFYFVSDWISVTEPEDVTEGMLVDVLKHTAQNETAPNFFVMNIYKGLCGYDANKFIKIMIEIGIHGYWRDKESRNGQHLVMYDMTRLPIIKREVLKSE